jgi:hypothetical protein
MPAGGPSNFLLSHVPITCRFVELVCNSSMNSHEQQHTSSQSSRCTPSSTADATTLLCLPALVTQPKNGYALSCSMLITPAGTGCASASGAARRCCLACFLALLAPFLPDFLPEEAAAAVDERALVAAAEGEALRESKPCSQDAGDVSIVPVGRS